MSLNDSAPLVEARCKPIIEALAGYVLALERLPPGDPGLKAIPKMLHGLATIENYILAATAALTPRRDFTVN